MHKYLIIILVGKLIESSSFIIQLKSFIFDTKVKKNDGLISSATNIPQLFSVALVLHDKLIIITIYYNV